MIKIEPPHITGLNTHEQLQQVIRYLQGLSEQLNVELNTELENLQKTKEEGND
jgi:EAL domain-containing protein (putative c-di-GMP-specific phosphodiesterase class I)